MSSSEEYSRAAGELRQLLRLVNMPDQCPFDPAELRKALAPFPRRRARVESRAVKPEMTVESVYKGNFGEATSSTWAPIHWRTWAVYVQDLQYFKARELLEIYNFGSRRLEAVKRLLESFGINLLPDAADRSNWIVYGEEIIPRHRVLEMSWPQLQKLPDKIGRSAHFRKNDNPPIIALQTQLVLEMAGIHTLSELLSRTPEELKLELKDHIREVGEIAYSTGNLDMLFINLSRDLARMGLEWG